MSSYFHTIHLTNNIEDARYPYASFPCNSSEDPISCLVCKSSLREPPFELQNDGPFSSHKDIAVLDCSTAPKTTKTAHALCLSYYFYTMETPRCPGCGTHNIEAPSFGLFSNKPSENGFLTRRKIEKYLIPPKIKSGFDLTLTPEYTSHSFQRGFHFSQPMDHQGTNFLLSRCVLTRNLGALETLLKENHHPYCGKDAYLLSLNRIRTYSARPNCLNLDLKILELLSQNIDPSIVLSGFYESLRRENFAAFILLLKGIKNFPPSYPILIPPERVSLIMTSAFHKDPYFFKTLLRKEEDPTIVQYALTHIPQNLQKTAVEICREKRELKTIQNTIRELVTAVDGPIIKEQLEFIWDLLNIFSPKIREEKIAIEETILSIVDSPYATYFKEKLIEVDEHHFKKFSLIKGSFQKERNLDPLELLAEPKLTEKLSQEDRDSLFLEWLEIALNRPNRFDSPSQILGQLFCLNISTSTLNKALNSLEARDDLENQALIELWEQIQAQMDLSQFSQTDKNV